MIYLLYRHAYIITHTYKKVKRKKLKNVDFSRDFSFLEHKEN